MLDTVVSTRLAKHISDWILWDCWECWCIIVEFVCAQGLARCFGHSEHRSKRRPTEKLVGIWAAEECEMWTTRRSKVIKWMWIKTIMIPTSGRTSNHQKLVPTFPWTDNFAWWWQNMILKKIEAPLIAHYDWMKNPEMKVSLMLGHLPYAVGKQSSVPMINLVR